MTNHTPPPVASDETAATSVRQLPDDSTQTSADFFGMLRDRTRLLNEDTAGIHDQVTGHHYDALLEKHKRLASELAKQDPVGLLERLNDAGYSWRDVASLVEVSVPALRKWRKRIATPNVENRRAIAELVALHDELERIPIVDPAGWLEMPLDDQVPLSRMNLAIGKRWDLLLAMAYGHIEGDQALDQFLPEWRAIYEGTDWEVFKAEDGNYSIRAKSDDR